MNDQSLKNLLRDSLGGRNLYLVGMMGSGKSSTGPFLADKLSYGFVDCDSVVEEVSKKSISEIFFEEGERSFRDSESMVLNEIGQRHSLVVSTGGGVVTRSENWGVLHKGLVIWIDPDRDLLFKRLQSDKANRPLMQQQDPIVAFDNLLKERLPIYQEADVHIKVFNQSPEEVASLIVSDLSSFLKQNSGLSG